MPVGIIDIRLMPTLNIFTFFILEYRYLLRLADKIF